MCVFILISSFLLGFQSIDPTNGSKNGNSNVVTHYEPINTYYRNTIVYLDDFDGDNTVAGLLARRYKIFNNSSPVGSSSWFQGNTGVFNAFNGPATGYVAANYQSTSGIGNVDVWLITPKISGGIFAGDILSFWTRSTDITGTDYPDSIRVYLSPNGDSTLNGSYIELGRFKVLKPAVGAPNNGYEQKIFPLLTTASNGRIVIRYSVVNGGPSGANSDYIGIDALKIERGGSNLPLGTFNLASPSNGVYTSSTPNFIWGASENAIFYKLFIDGVLYKDSIYSTNYQLQQFNALSDVTHTWNIQSYNLSGVRQSNQTWSILVDSTAPSAFDLISPLNNSWSNIYKPNMQWNPSIDAKSGLAKYQLWIDGVLNRDNIAPGTTTIKPLNNLSNGSHLWQVKAFDNVGNIRTSNQTWITKIDSVAPNFNNENYNLSFNGSSSYVNIGNNSLLNMTYNKTIEVWVRFFSGGNNSPRIVSKQGDNLGMPGDYAIYTEGTGTIRKIRFWIQNLGEIQSTNNLNAGNFYHIAATISGNSSTSQMKLYVDGNLEASINTTGTHTPSTTPLVFGRKGIGTNFYDMLNGTIDDVRIWNFCKSQSEIQQQRYSYLSGNEPGLVGLWNFDEGSGSIAYDRTGNSNNGSIIAATYLLSNTPDRILITPSNNQYLQSNLPYFTWRKANDAGVGFGKFQLFIDGNLNADNLSDTIFISTSPLNYGSHTWFIKAFDLLGNNKSSETGTFYIDNASPNPFNLLAPADSQIVNLPTPNFSWQGTIDSSGGSGLRKYQLIINGNVSIDSISPNVTTSSPGNALAQGVYSWYVKAYDNLGNIRYSTQTRTFYADWEPPTAFTTILPNNGDTSLFKRPTFSWHKSNDIGSGLTKYELIISGQQIITVPVTDTVKQTTFDLPNGNYTWYVKAYDRAGSFTSSNVKSLTVASIPLPLTPTLFLPVNSSVNQPTDAFFFFFRPGEYARNTKENFHFDNQLSILKFWFELTTDTVSFSNGLRDTSVTDTVKSVLGLSNLTTYYWRVKAKNLFNYGPFSNWNKFSTTGISSFALSSGWNIFSVPLLSQDMSVANIIPGASSQAFGYNNGYQQTSVLQNGKGYWIKYDSLRNFTVTGLPVTPRSINVLEGWNIIGPFETSVPVSSITSNPSGIIISNFFGFNNGYSNATTLAPGKGYWVKTSQSGSLILPSAPLASRDISDTSKENENWIRIKISDSKQNITILYLGNNENVTGIYTLPPVGPSGVFDARFSSDNYVDIWKGSHVIKINTTEYPVKLKVENLKGKTLRIKDNVTGKLLDQILADGAEIIINLNLESLILTEEVIIPTTFELSQNYPNPFNPATTIKYQIPKDEFVKITVYDLLGREIKLLVNDFKPAGYYDIKFDASNLASGVYFYQINAGNFKNIKKMVVMK